MLFERTPIIGEHGAIQSRHGSDLRRSSALICEKHVRRIIVRSSDVYWTNANIIYSYQY